MSESRVLNQDMSNTKDRNIIHVTRSKRRGTYKYPMFGQHNLAKQYFSNLIYKWNHCKYLFSCVFSLKTSSLSTLSLQYDKRIQDDLRGGKRKIRLVQEQVNLGGISKPHLSTLLPQRLQNLASGRRVLECLTIVHKQLHTQQAKCTVMFKSCTWPRRTLNKSGSVAKLKCLKVLLSYPSLIGSKEGSIIIIYLIELLYFWTLKYWLWSFSSLYHAGVWNFKDLTPKLKRIPK